MTSSAAPFTHLEQAVQHSGQCKVWPQLLILQVILVLPQPLSPEGHIPPQQIALVTVGCCMSLGISQVLLQGATATAIARMLDM
jgi:hypothetical protein